MIFDFLALFQHIFREFSKILLALETCIAVE